MFKTVFQGAPFIMIMEARGPTPLSQWDTKKVQCQRLFNKEIKTYVIDVTGQNISSCRLPADEKQIICIQQQCLALQMFLPKDQAFTLTVTIQTASQSKIRLVFTTSVKTIKVTTLNARIPLKTVAGVWSTLVLDLGEIVPNLFKNQEYNQILTLEVAPYVTLFRIFSLLKCPLPTIELFDPVEESKLLKNRYAAPPPFSKRIHVPLPEKVDPPLPFHVQIIDQFYLSLFDEKRGVLQLGVRDLNGILESRSNFIPGFNGFTNYEQIQPKINKSQIQVTDNPPEQDQMDDAYQQIQRAEDDKKFTKVQKFEFTQSGAKLITQDSQSARGQQKHTITPVRGPISAKKPTGPAPVSVVAQTLRHLHQTHQENVQQADQIVQQYENAVNTNVYVSNQQRTKEFNENLKLQSKPPQIMKDIKQCNDVNNPDYCNTDVDLTLNARPVVIDVSDAKRKKDEHNPRSMTPLKDVNNEPQVQSNQPNNDQEDDLGTQQWDGETLLQTRQRIDVDDGAEFRDSTNGMNMEQYEQQLNAQQDQCEAIENQYVQSNNRVSVKHITQPFRDQYEFDGMKSVEHRPIQSPNSQQQMQDAIPDPQPNSMQLNDNLPNPNDVLQDPVAYGLRYDPATKAFYEADE